MPLSEKEQRELEKLFINNENFNEIRAYVSRFNPIKIMNMERMEIRHSAILAWLLDPNETHCFGEEFLKGFLGEAFRDYSENIGINALDIFHGNFKDVEIRREWHNIDIFIFIRNFIQDSNWAFIIENKFDSTQGKGQLAGYRKKVKEIFGSKSDIQVMGIFLTLQDEPPEDKAYATIRYDSICNILKQQININKNSMPTEVMTFVNHYLEIIGEATGMNDQHKKMEALARKLYKEHKNALNFIIGHGMDTDFGLAVDILFGDDAEYPKEIVIGKDNDGFIFGNKHGKNTVSFLPKSWYQALVKNKDAGAWSGCEKYWMNFPVITWISLDENKNGNGGKIGLYTEVGPLSENNLRIKLIESIEALGSKRIAFHKSAKGDRAKFSRFLRNNTKKIEDVQNPEEIAQKMEQLLNTFKQEFIDIGNVLEKWGEQYLSQ